jgi:phosphomannomutase
MAVKGHIYGKDGIYAAALLVEMLAVTGKTVGQLYQEVVEKYGRLYFDEASCEVTSSRKQELYNQIFMKEQIPAFEEQIARISWADGCKIYFEDGSWVICRFSGTEPLVRIAAEGNTLHQTRNYIQKWESFLKQ